MNDFVLARALHVIGVVLWIGGVAMVTTVLLSAAKRLATPAERIAFLERVEHRFAAQAKVTTLVTGLSGFYMVWRFELWSRFAEARFWWMHAMVAVWMLFTLVLFVLEPLVLRRWFGARAARNPQGTFAWVQRFHWLLLALSVVTIAGAVAGSHGGWLQAMELAVMKVIHVTAAVVSYVLFVVRGIWMISGSPRLGERWVRIAPHVNDTLLLAAAIWMTILTHQYPGTHAWLTAKLVALVVYIGLGTVALKRGKTRCTRIAAWLGSQAVFFYIVAVALTRNPLPWS